jgi:type II secretory pathway pseudopilin PulG
MMRDAIQQRLSRRRQTRAGFTLIEAAIVTVIVGVAIVGLVQLLAAGTYANSESTELTTGIGLASNIREMAYGVAYDDIMTLDGKTCSPPKNARDENIDDLADWKQVVTINYVDPDHLTLTVPKTQVEPVALITVTVSHNNRTVYTTDWLAAASEWP